MPAMADPEPQATADEKQLVISYGERRYRVRGWPKQLGEALKANILVSAVEAPSEDAALHVDTLDL
jgi:DNA primase